MSANKFVICTGYALGIEFDMFDAPIYFIFYIN